MGLRVQAFKSPRLDLKGRGAPGVLRSCAPDHPHLNLVGFVGFFPRSSLLLSRHLTALRFEPSGWGLWVWHVVQPLKDGWTACRVRPPGESSPPCAPTASHSRRYRSTKRASSSSGPGFRGLVTLEQVAELRFAGDIEQAKSFFRATPGELTKILKLDEVPDLDLAEREARVDEASRTSLACEVNRSWVVQDTWAARKP